MLRRIAQVAVFSLCVNASARAEEPAPKPDAAKAAEQEKLDQEIKEAQAKLQELQARKDKAVQEKWKELVTPFVQDKERFPGHKINLDSYLDPYRALTVQQFSKICANWTLDRVPKNLLQKMVGSAPPNQKVKLRDGGAVDLDLYKDKKVVVLGFWALGCIDCVLPLPYYADLADAFKEKDVAVFAVEFRGNANRSFLEKQDFKLPVALGISAFGEPYGLNHKMPYLYVIGKDGKVKAIHLLIDPKLVTVVKAEVEALLAGQELPVAEPPRKESASK